MRIAISAGTLLIILAGCGGSGSKAQREREAAAAAKRWEQEDRKQSDRQELIDKLIDQNVFRKVDVREQGATILVEPAFLLLDFEAKQTFSGVVYAYLSTKARSDFVTVTLKEPINNKTVGRHTSAGLAME